MLPLLGQAFLVYLNITRYLDLSVTASAQLSHTRMHVAEHAVSIKHFDAVSCLVTA